MFVEQLELLAFDMAQEEGTATKSRKIPVDIEQLKDYLGNKRFTIS